LQNENCKLNRLQFSFCFFVALAMTARVAFALIVCLQFGELACAASLPPCIKPNLLVNGSFEEGPEPGPFLPVNPGDTRIRGWTVTRGQIDYIGTHWQAAEGKRSLDLHGSPGFGGVAQSFATKAGRGYRATFMLSRSPNVGGEIAVIVEAGGNRIVHSVPHRGATAQNMQWVRYEFEFTANSEKTTLEIRTIGHGDPNAGPTLDDVTVVER